MNIFKKTITYIAVLILSVSAVTAFSYWDKLTDSKEVTVPLGEWRTIEISTAQEFYDMVNSQTEAGITYKLTNDIDFGSFVWNYDSSMDGNTFKGIFDGDGHTLLNITITSSDTNSVKMSIFSNTESATIKNVTVENYKMGFDTAYYNATDLEAAVFSSRVSGSNNLFENITLKNVDVIGNSVNGAGGLITTVAGDTDLIIRNIKATDLTVLNSSKRSAGLISRALKGNGTITIEDIDLQGNIAANNNTSNTGGIIGTIQNLPFTLNRAIVEYEAEGTIQLTDGSITYKSNRYAGGFVGNNNNNVSTTISDSFYTGKLYTERNRMGSAVGREQKKSTSLYNTFYSNVLFNNSYTPNNSTTGINSTVVHSNSMPDNTWWNNFKTAFDSANSLWTQDPSGRLTLIR